MKKTKSVLDLKGMFKAPPGVQVSIEEMRLGFERLDPWRVESLVMTEVDWSWTSPASTDISQLLVR